jgi:hypothetical protein
MARSPAPRAAPRTHRRAGRRPSCPKLDVDRGLDDPCVASLDCRQLPSAEHGGRTVLLHRPPTFCPSPVPDFFSGAPSTTPTAILARNAQTRRGRCRSRPPHSPHAACTRSTSRPSATLLGNSCWFRVSIATFTLPIFGCERRRTGSGWAQVHHGLHRNVSKSRVRRTSRPLDPSARGSLDVAPSSSVATRSWTANSPGSTGSDGSLSSRERVLGAMVPFLVPSPVQPSRKRSDLL